MTILAILRYRREDGSYYDEVFSRHNGMLNATSIDWENDLFCWSSRFATKQEGNDWYRYLIEDGFVRLDLSNRDDEIPCYLDRVRSIMRKKGVKPFIIDPDDD